MLDDTPSTVLLWQRFFDGAPSMVLFRQRSFNGAPLMMLLQWCFFDGTPSTMLLWHWFFDGSPTTALTWCFHDATSGDGVSNNSTSDGNWSSNPLSGSWLQWVSRQKVGSCRRALDDSAPFKASTSRSMTRCIITAQPCCMDRYTQWPLSTCVKVAGLHHLAL